MNILIGLLKNSKLVKNILILIVISFLLVFTYNKITDIAERLTDYELKKQELKETKSELDFAYQQLDDYNEKVLAFSLRYNQLADASEKLEKENQKLLIKANKHDYEAINKKKPKLAESIYEKSFYNYYDEFYDCKLCSSSSGNSESSPTP